MKKKMESLLRQLAAYNCGSHQAERGDRGYVALQSVRAVMTVDDLIADAWRNRTGPADPSNLSPSDLGDFLRMALGYLLEDLDYEADKKCGSAVAARILAALITCADETAEKALQ